MLEPQFPRYNPYMNKNFPRSYKYYDTPEGQDVGQKLFYMLKTSTRVGLATGILAAFLLRKPTDMRFKFYADIARYGIPWIMSGATYTIAAYGMTNYRGKDDERNSEFGGALAGLVFGAWFQSVPLTLVTTSVFTYAASLKKTAHLNGIPFPNHNFVKEVDSSWALRKLNFSFTKNYEDKELFRK